MELYNNDCSNQSTIVHVIDIAGNVLLINQSSSSLVNINADVSPNTHIG